MKRFSKLGAFFLVLCLALPAAAMGLQEAKNQLDTAKQQGLSLIHISEPTRPY